MFSSSDVKPAAATRRAAGHMHVSARAAVTRWLLDPTVAIPQDVREALLADHDMSLLGVGSSYLNFMLLNGVCCRVTGGWTFYILLAFNLLLGAVRVASCAFILSGKADKRPAATDLYVMVTLLWCFCQGTMSGVAAATNIPVLQILGAAWILSVQGPLCARNYPSPRFAMAILCALDLPFVLGTAAARNHWLLCIVLVTPSYIYASLGTIRRFQKISIDNMLGHLHSRRQARRDELTGTLNRFGLMEMLQDAPPPRLSLFCLDLDGFKNVNDRYGHHAGDNVLRLGAERLRRVCRDSDVVARLGGDEFVIIAPNMPPTVGEAFAARLVDVICGEPFPLGNGLTASIGVSVGFACVPEDGATFNEIYLKADAALYKVKEHGKRHWRRAIAA